MYPSGRTGAQTDLTLDKRTPLPIKLRFPVKRKAYSTINSYNFIHLSPLYLESRLSLKTIRCTITENQNPQQNLRNKFTKNPQDKQTHVQILATFASSDWISSAACKIASIFVVWASEGGTAPAIPLGVLSWPWPAVLSCSLFSVARTSLSQLSRTLAMLPAPIGVTDAQGGFNDPNSIRVWIPRLGKTSRDCLGWRRQFEPS